MSESEREEALRALQELQSRGINVEGEDSSDPSDFDDGEAEGLSVREAIELLSKIEEVGEPLLRGQWSRTNGLYTMVGETVPLLPPGFYDMVSAQGQLFFMPIGRRTDKLLRFPHAQVGNVITEIEKFWCKEEQFRKFHLPYKRGVLLYGPPGSGKTCALQLIARDVVDRGGIVLLWHTDLFTAGYRQLRRVQPDTPIVVLMEDLDAILDNRLESVVLNLLDGAESIHKVVFLATTNYPEKLGPRIINRPSRFDQRIRVGHPDEQGRKMYLDSLLEGHDDVEIDRAAYIRGTQGMSLAHLKELFVATVIIGVPFKDALAQLKVMHLEMDKASSVFDDEEHGAEVRRGQYA